MSYPKAYLWMAMLTAFAGVTHAAEEFSVLQLRDNVFAAMRNDPPGFAVESNAGFVECADHVVVIDAQSNDATTAKVLAEIRRRTHKPVRYLINTHWHDDHIVGNRMYRDAFPEAKLIAHAAAVDYLPGKGKKNRDQFHRAIPGVLDSFRKALQAGKNSTGKPLSEEQRRSLASDIRLGEGYATVPDDFVALLPDIAVEENYSIRDQGCAIDVLALGNAHTTGDLVVHLPEQRVVFVGDIVGWPVPLVGPDQSRVREWSGTLTRIRGLKAALIVPGHGPVMRDNAHVDRIINLMSTIVRRVDEARVGGTDTLEKVRGEIDLRDLRREFASGSEVNGALFDGYVSGPAITNVWNIR
ncbi:MBL fold metallo-hydrolase [Steroidobacter sp.]|uniref:MBL fold metallo-hydrolase n=1 Tax=Steroidobacter sp. TaxID=1978227 RepID=UPI001A4C323D|nr:MBL fold metallo-hydrolase [Steroidobacter sp.]MBL8270561.1 MBL fold metallo-hydrolase [Steroidobacter sp.]